MRWIRSLALTLTFGFAIVGSAQASALEVPAVPPLNRPVVDMAGVLSQSDIDTISSTINQSRTKKDYQMAVLVVPTLGTDEYIEGYSIKVARAWGIGTEKQDNGVLLLVAKDDHKMRIEVGRGLEGDLTDAESSRINRNIMAPEFRKNNFAGGITKAVQSIAAEVEGVPDPNAATTSDSSNRSGSFDFTWLFFFGFWILPWISSVLARSKSWWAGGLIGGGLGIGFAALVGWAMWALIGAAIIAIIGFFFDYVVSKNYRHAVDHDKAPSWWAGGTYWGGGSGGSGGSDGGFGGGGFSGGGSSGDW